MKWKEPGFPGWVQHALPRREWRTTGVDAAFYGATYEIENAIGSELGIPTSRWMHGVHLNLPPTTAIYFHNWWRPIGAHFLTHRSEQADFLDKDGNAAAVAVGAPILYAPDLPCQRVEGSVLFVPRHSTAHYDYPESTDIGEAIGELRRLFERIVVCVYGECARRGKLPRMLEEAGVDWIVGAHVNDRYSLRRMRHMFRTFDFVASDSYGSHLAYAAYFGAKVFCPGNWKDRTADNVLGDSPELKKRYPELVDWYVECHRWETIRRIVPGIERVDGSCRKEQREWASAVIGAPNRRDASEVAELLGWRWWSHFDRRTRGRLCSRLKRWFG